MVRVGKKHSCFVQPHIAVIARRREAIGLAKQTFEMTSANPKLDGDAFDRNRFFEVGVHQQRRIREIHSRSRTLQSGIASLKVLHWHGPMHRYRWAHNVTWRKNGTTVAFCLLSTPLAFAHGARLPRPLQDTSPREKRLRRVVHPRARRLTNRSARSIQEDSTQR